MSASEFPSKAIGTNACLIVQLFPSNKPFEGLVLGKAKLIIDSSRLSVAGFGALPKLTRVRARE